MLNINISTYIISDSNECTQVNWREEKKFKKQNYYNTISLRSHSVCVFIPFSCFLHFLVCFFFITLVFDHISYCESVWCCMLIECV